MKTKYLSIIIFVFIGSCKRFDANRITKVTTKDLFFAKNNAQAIGTIIDISDKGIQDHGFFWSYNLNSTLIEGKISLKSTSSSGDFKCNFPNLIPDVTYKVRAFAQSNNQFIYGEMMSFNTSQSNVTIGISSPIIINSGKIKIDGTIDSVGNIVVAKYGHCYSTNPNPTITDGSIINYDLKKDSTFTSEISGLSPNTTYYIKTYAILSESKVIYSNSQTVKIPMLQVTTDTLTTINSAISNLKGTIQNLGADPITEYGFVWSSTNPNPYYGDNKLVNPASPKVGAYLNDLTGLISGTKYYFRAYATNGSIVVYGNIKSIQK